jgi:large subunit ribosomal protein L3
VGFGKAKKVSRALQGHLRGEKGFRWLREVRVPAEKVSEYKVGQQLDVSLFQPGDCVKIVGTSKGKGFAGVVRRHGFRGGPKTHGQKHSLRAPGSIGPTALQRVPRGRRMAGHMGGERVTVKNLKVVSVDAERGLLIVGGAVPGSRGSLVKVMSQ